MQTDDTLKALINHITFDAPWFENFRFLLRYTNEIPYLQIKFNAPCNMTGEMQEQSGRKWMLSYHMTNDEVISTAFAATKMCVEHETRELFKWWGEPIYRPHYDPIALYKISASNRTLKRGDTT